MGPRDALNFQISFLERSLIRPCAGPFHLVKDNI